MSGGEILFLSEDTVPSEEPLSSYHSSSCCADYTRIEWRRYIWRSFLCLIQSAPTAVVAPCYPRPLRCRLKLDQRHVSPPAGQERSWLSVMAQRVPPQASGRLMPYTKGALLVSPTSSLCGEKGERRGRGVLVCWCMRMEDAAE